MNSSLLYAAATFDKNVSESIIKTKQKNIGKTGDSAIVESEQIYMHQRTQTQP